MIGNNIEETPPMDMKIRVIHWLIMNGLGCVVLAVWVWTLQASNTEQQKRLDSIITTNQAQTEKLITVLTEIRQYMEQSKYDARIQSIRNK